jgi:hypothetical protein
MTSRPPFPAVIDATLLGAFRSCPQKANLAYIYHWKPQAESVHLVAGAAYANGLERARTAFYVEGKHPSICIEEGVKALLYSYGTFECPPDSAKSPARTAGALEFYFDSYPLGSDKAIPMTLPGGKKGIEFSFLEPLAVQHPETKEPLLYSGRMDMICEYEGMHLGEDDKTTSSLGASWSQQWDLRSQFTGYVWGAARARIKLDGFLIRGVSILKTKYDTQQAITYRPQWQLDRWYEQTIRDLHRMIDAWNTGYFDFNLDHACAEYGGCQFRQICQLRDPTSMLQSRFERRRWDPVKRTEELMEV